MSTKTKQKIIHHTDHDESIPPRAIDAIRARANMDLVDITVGPMTLKELTNEIENIFYRKTPQSMVILIERREDIQKYQSAIYITKEDFKKKMPSYLRNLYVKKHLKI